MKALKKVLKKHGKVHDAAVGLGKRSAAKTGKKVSPHVSKKAASKDASILGKEAHHGKKKVHKKKAAAKKKK